MTVAVAARLATLNRGGDQKSGDRKIKAEISALMTQPEAAKRLCVRCGLQPPAHARHVCAACAALRCDLCHVWSGGHKVTCLRHPPRYCISGCGGVAVPRFRYCAACFALPRCSQCDRPTSNHRPGCPRLTQTPRCRVCGVATDDVRGRGAVVCSACRANCCPICKRNGGRHDLHHRRPPRPRVYRGEVSAEDLERVFVDVYATALRCAWAITGREADARDCVQHALTDVWQRRESLRREGSLYGYTLRAVEHAAQYLMRKQRNYERLVPMDADALMRAEYSHWATMFGHRVGAVPR